VRLLDITRGLTPGGVDDKAMTSPDPGARFTPRQFFREAGTLIAVCLSLGLLMRVLLG
jgi:hypothetical protein